MHIFLTSYTGKDKVVPVHDMTACGRVAVQFHLSSTSALDTELPSSCHGCFISVIH
jgi:hypothetical protein